ncbi:MAG: hypothetical protein RI885_1784 [Actinomycetota bacterium]
MPSRPAPTPADGRRPASRHRANIDTAALAHNLALVGHGTVVDLSGDAYGHGAETVAAVVASLPDDGKPGLRSLGVRSARELAVLAELGIQAELLDSPLLGAPDDDELSSLTERIYGVGTEPVMRVSADVVNTKIVATGDGVSYGYTWRASEPTAIALIALGYADGVLRSAGNTARVLLGGGMRRLVGRVAMDACVVEIGPADRLRDVAIGDHAVLFGEPGVAESGLGHWASTLGVPPLSVTSGVGARVPRIPT